MQFEYLSIDDRHIYYYRLLQLSPRDSIFLPHHPTDPRLLHTTHCYYYYYYPLLLLLLPTTTTTTITYYITTFVITTTITLTSYCHCDHYSHDVSTNRLWVCTLSFWLHRTASLSLRHSLVPTDLGSATCSHRWKTSCAQMELACCHSTPTAPSSSMSCSRIL